MEKPIDVGGIPMVPVDGDVKRVMAAAQAMHKDLERRSKKCRDMAPADFQIQVLFQMLVGTANALRALNPDWHAAFVTQCINAMTADPAELQRIADGQTTTKH